jgi:hypothetical protein
VCIGDTDLARHATPGISALTWDLDQMGRVAANILLDRIRGGDKARKVRPVYRRPVSSFGIPAPRLAHPDGVTRHRSPRPAKNAGERPKQKTNGKPRE